MPKGGGEGPNTESYIPCMPEIGLSRLPGTRKNGLSRFMHTWASISYPGNLDFRIQDWQYRDGGGDSKLKSRIGVGWGGDSETRFQDLGKMVLKILILGFFEVLFRSNLGFRILKGQKQEFLGILQANFRIFLLKSPNLGLSIYALWDLKSRIQDFLSPPPSRALRRSILGFRMDFEGWGGPHPIPPCPGIHAQVGKSLKNRSGPKCQMPNYPPPLARFCPAEKCQIFRERGGG